MIKSLILWSTLTKFTSASVTVSYLVESSNNTEFRRYYFGAKEPPPRMPCHFFWHWTLHVKPQNRFWSFGTKNTWALHSSAQTFQSIIIIEFSCKTGWSLPNLILKSCVSLESRSDRSVKNIWCLKKIHEITCNNVAYLAETSNYRL